MPFVKIHHDKSLSQEDFRLVSSAVHEALKNNFNVPEQDVFHLGSIYENDQFIFDESYLLSDNKKRAESLLYIDILCGDGRTKQQKMGLFSEITANVTSQISIKDENIFITISESPRSNWSFGEGKAQMTQNQINRELSPTSVNKFSDENPTLAKYSKHILLDEVWMDGALTSKERSFVTLTALASLVNTEQMSFHLKTAYDNGVSKDELVALVTHLAFYIGLPLAMQLQNKIGDM